MRGARKSGPLWDLRASVSEEAFFALEKRAEEGGRTRTRYAGLLLEGLLEAMSRLSPLDRRLLELHLLEGGSVAQGKRAFAALQKAARSLPRKRPARPGQRAA